jgi:hypothetical protein
VGGGVRIADSYGVGHDGSKSLCDLIPGTFALRKKIGGHGFCECGRAVAAIGLIGK